LTPKATSSTPSERVCGRENREGYREDGGKGNREDGKK
jgi:hypothetical protein